MAAIKKAKTGRKRRVPEVIVNADIGDVVNVDQIELISADSQAPDTFKIVCPAGSEDIYEIYEEQDPVPVKSEEMPTIPEAPEDEPMNDDELHARVTELLKIVVDEEILTKFGYPTVDVDSVLTSVLQECEQNPVDIASCADVGTKIRENVKILFTTVIGDDSISEMLNNHTVDEVINHVIAMADV